MINIHINRMVGTHISTTSATPAILTNYCAFALQLDGLRKADLMGASAATDTIVIYFDGHTGHCRNFISDLGCDIRQYAPQAATRAAVADGKKFMAGADIEPDRIKLITPDHMNQSGLTAFLNMCQGLPGADRPSEFGINPLGRLSEENTTEIDWIILAGGCLTANTGVHDPMIVCFPYEMFHNL